MKKTLLAVLFLLCMVFFSSCKNELKYEEYYYQFGSYEYNKVDSFIITSTDDLNYYLNNNNYGYKSIPTQVINKEKKALDELPIDFEKEKLIVIEYYLGHDVGKRYINIFNYDNGDFSIEIYEDGDIYMEMESTIAYCIKVDKEVNIKSVSCKIIEKRSDSEKAYYDFKKSF